MEVLQYTALRLATTSARRARIIPIARHRTFVRKHLVRSRTMANWTSLRSEDEKYGYRTLEDGIQKPDLDDRDYRLIELDNGLRALLVHDAGAEKAAACLAVQVGAMLDPVGPPSPLKMCGLTIVLAARCTRDRPFLRASAAEGHRTVPRRKRLLFSEPAIHQSLSCSSLDALNSTSRPMAARRMRRPAQS